MNDFYVIPNNKDVVFNNLILPLKDYSIGFDVYYTVSEINSLSKKLNISSKYLSNTCKSNSGKTAYEWIIEYAVEDISRCLSHSDMSIKEIAGYLDFPNLSFFGKFVKAHLGCSPTEYRRIKGKAIDLEK